MVSDILGIVILSEVNNPRTKRIVAVRICYIKWAADAYIMCNVYDNSVQIAVRPLDEPEQRQTRARVRMNCD